MNKFTFLFAALALIFAGTTGFVSYKLLKTHEQAETPRVGGSAIALGLPSLRGEDPAALFRSHSAVLWDIDSQQIRFEQNGFERMPIASLTKLMTAMIALDYGIEWDKEVEILPEEYVQGGRLILHNGERVTMKDLFNASLLASANNTTLALVRELGVPEEEFIQAMNRKAVELGLEQTMFVEVTGLDPDNVSTAYEVAKFAQHAFLEYAEIAEATSQKEYAFHVRGSDREHIIRNSNKLVSDWEEHVTGSKTGYLYEARYCLVVKGEGDFAGRIAVVLSSPSEIENLAETQKLLRMQVR